MNKSFAIFNKITSTFYMEGGLFNYINFVCSLEVMGNSNILVTLMSKYMDNIG